ncbi:MAG: alpha/beta hydrolase [Bacteroidia bacterium]|nr:alpha/beta hydrolase [Bacteroidia bacterium]
MDFKINKEQKFEYIDEGQGPPLLLLHGLFGALSNWMDVVEHFKGSYRVLIPLMPIYDSPLISTNVKHMAEFIHSFVKDKDLNQITLVGNSLGGHVALVYVLAHPGRVQNMVLTGSSGLYENAMGGTYPKREDYEFIKKKVQLTFYDPEAASKELVDEVFGLINNKNKLIRILALAKSAIRHNMSGELHNINVPTSLIWGKNDTITPPEVAEEFHRLLPQSDLFFIDKCGHAPMMEHPQEFNRILDGWLKKQKVSQA